ncbi:putative zinc-binding protein [Clostridiales Family XIII bacterium ASD5510]|uniref:Zinc-binding protein n=1 Tax=Hominibacterium faecale TaxID=2839743 RepID=A0A9J6QS39_9FIRM|nr:putative zinc-binding protein [Hominibacterium faecale]MCU7378946.1 putative zinc-binding protein [Hominibacterium faecale]
MSKVKVAACSGIGKVFGLLARESALEAVKLIGVDKAEMVCLAHVVTGEEESIDKTKGKKFITVDGCPTLCAAKSVAASGGVVCEQYRAVDEIRKYRGAKPGNASELTQGGWEICDAFAKEIADKILEVSEEE